jgi:protein-tyrosine-phosphatase
MLSGRRRREFLRRVVRDGTVAVACLGNICRSPYAAHRLERALGRGWTVIQGGTHALPGTPSPPLAVTAAAERGVDLAGHRARRITEADVTAVDAVLVFDHDNVAHLNERFPQSADRVFLLGEVVAGPTVVADPFGGSIEAYRATYRTIDAMVAELAEALERRH